MRNIIRRISESGRKAPRLVRDVYANSVATTWIAQQQLLSTWIALPTDKVPSAFRQCGFRVFSQFEEDGLLLFIFARIGTTNRVCVDIGAGGAMGNSANLIVHHLWQGYLYDGDPKEVARAREFFSRFPWLMVRPLLRYLWVETETIEKELQADGVPPEPDFLSIDIDGCDWWVFKCLELFRPRVVMVEAHDIIPLPLALTVPYSRAFVRGANADDDFMGASLGAWIKLMCQRGYRLVGANRWGFNAIFMRNDVGVEEFRAVEPTDIHANPWTAQGQAMRWPLVQGCPWVAV